MGGQTDGVMGSAATVLKTGYPTFGSWCLLPVLICIGSFSVFVLFSVVFRSSFFYPFYLTVDDQFASS